jgi:predicted transposase YbfD/YdcC
VVESITLLQALSAVPDPRRPRGRRHSLASILFLATGAVMAGARSYAAIAQWAHHADAPVAVCRASPHAATFARVLAAVEVTVLQQALTGWVLARRAAAHAPVGARGDVGPPVAEDRTVLAFDGKNLRGAGTGTGGQAKLAAVFDHAHGLVLAQAEVADGAEPAAFIPALEILPDLRGVLITADALHCQRAHATYLHGRGAHYLFTVKGNQPALRRALAGLPWAQAPGLIERQQGHGRIESRSIKVIDLDGHPASELFPHAARAIKVVRRRRRQSTGTSSVEVVYAITSLGYRQADPALLAAWIQSHWTIENAVHHVRDVTPGEDRSSVRAGSGPQVMAALRNTALNLNRLDGHTNIASAQRQTSWRPQAALQTITAA